MTESLRPAFEESHPDFPWLAEGNTARAAFVIGRLGYLGDEEEVVGCTRAGEGNMNLTLRLEIQELRGGWRTLILKQARPWVEKYDWIAAPWDRVEVERRFYEQARRLRGVGESMPHLIGGDSDSKILLLEDLRGSRDLSTLYSEGDLGEDDIRALGVFLRELHRQTQGHDGAGFENREMRELNAAHLFEVPFDADNGVDLDSLEPGLSAVAAELRGDAALIETAQQLKTRYLADGSCLLHGDYFPGSWLRTSGGQLRVIDPEFAFFGDPEFDLGVLLAHLALSGQDPALDEVLLATLQEVPTSESQDAEEGGGDHSDGSDSAEPGRQQASSEGDGGESETVDADAVEPEPVEPDPVEYDLGLAARYAGLEVIRRLIGVAQLPLAPSEGRRAELLRRASAAARKSSLGELRA